MVSWIWKFACLRAGRFPRTSLHWGSNYISSTRDWRRIPAQKANSHCMDRSTESIWYSLDWWPTSKTNEMQHRWKYVLLDQIISTQSSSRVVIDNTKSKKILLRHGVPKGGVISLFLVFINDLIKKFPSPVKCVMFADDLVLWSTEEYETTAKVRLQESTNIL